MRIEANAPYTDVLEPGDALTVTPTSSAVVELLPLGGEPAKEALSAAKRYGPYTRGVEFRVTALGGRCTVAQAPVVAPLWVEGWDDLRFPAQGINPAGAVDAPTVDTTLTGYPGTLLFAGNQENVIAGIAQLPHTWKAGSALHPHIHWSKPVGSASAVSWVLYYCILGSPGDVHGALVGPLAGTLVAGDMATANQMLITRFDPIDMTGLKESVCLSWQIRRLGNTDADNGTARLFEFDLHFQADKGGTVAEFPT